ARARISVTSVPHRGRVSFKRRLEGCARACRPQGGETV
ncbi:MAG: hypothetical protein AVDCRST_MAG86-692, partial [uncultured Truepera sp.]